MNPTAWRAGYRKFVLFILCCLQVYQVIYLEELISRESLSIYVSRSQRRLHYILLAWEGCGTASEARITPFSSISIAKYIQIMATGIQIGEQSLRSAVVPVPTHDYW